jgi:hypothetical protein
MTFEELVNELKATGFDYVTDSRLEDWIQRSYQTLSARYRWPWAEALVGGVAPLAISGLRYVLSVNDGAQGIQLYAQDRQRLVECFPADPQLEETGNPLYWFLVDDAIRVYPKSSTNEIIIRYVKQPEVLKATSEPLIPSEWQYLIVDQARVYALKDNDEYQAASELKASVKEELNEMIADQLQRNWQAAPTIQRSGRPGDYL